MLIVVAGVLFASCAQSQVKKNTTQKVDIAPRAGEAVATFAEGCFWCSEEVFESLVGVREAVSGYAGGKTLNPTYEEVCSGTTGHAESVQIYYDPKKISYETLVEAFFASQDPTTPNQQGPDKGTQYRSAIFYRTDAEKTIAENTIKKLTAAKTFKKKIVTEVTKLSIFYPAEAYHQNYIVNNPDNPYVQSVSLPRYERFRANFKGNYKK